MVLEIHKIELILESKFYSNIEQLDFLIMIIGRARSL